jgi:hypothetical protein
LQSKTRRASWNRFDFSQALEISTDALSMSRGFFTGSAVFHTELGRTFSLCAAILLGASAFASVIANFPEPTSSNLAICGTLALATLAGRKFFKR